MENIDKKEVGSDRFFALDYLRGLAALSVVLFHYTFAYDNGLHELKHDKFYLSYGYLGVQLFFIISGFVIFMTLEKTKASLDFFVSRFSRLFPAYWGAIFFSLLFVSIIKNPFISDKVTITQVIVNLTMLQHWFKVKDIDGAYWTLSVELTFYFLMWVVFCFKKLKWIEVICLCWLFLSFWNQFKLPGKHIIEQIFILPHAPMFVTGIVFYNVKTKGKYNVFRIFLLLFSLFIESITLYKASHSLYPILIICLFYLMFIIIIGDAIILKRQKILQFFGFISYSLYLIHEDIGLAIEYQLRKITDLEVVYVILPMIISIFMAYLLTIYIERPLMKYIRLQYKKYKEKEPQHLPVQ